MSIFHTGSKCRAPSGLQIGGSSKMRLDGLTVTDTACHRFGRLITLFQFLRAWVGASVAGLIELNAINTSERRKMKTNNWMPSLFTIAASACALGVLQASEHPSVGY